VREKTYHEQYGEPRKGRKAVKGRVLQSLPKLAQGRVHLHIDIQELDCFVSRAKSYLMYLLHDLYQRDQQYPSYYITLHRYLSSSHLRDESSGAMNHNLYRVACGQKWPYQHPYIVKRRKEI
jgi:hypothetical protein